VGTVDKHVLRCILNILNNVPMSALMTMPDSELQRDRELAADCRLCSCYWHAT